MTIEAMKQALEALVWEAEGWEDAPPITRDAITALRAAIEQAEKPVAWMTHSNDMLPLFHKTRAAALNWHTQPTPLYTAPQPAQQPLTDEQIAKAWGAIIKYAPGDVRLKEFARAIEAKLKEKNG